MKGSLNVLKLFSPRLTQQIGPGRHLAAFFAPQEPEGDEGGVDDDGEGDVDLQQSGALQWSQTLIPDCWDHYIADASPYNRFFPCLRELA